jgi:hypothetical protein
VNSPEVETTKFVEQVDIMGPALLKFWGQVPRPAAQNIGLKFYLKFYIYEIFIKLARFYQN